jgi:probable HAF family extracellular repeat protein
MNRLLQVFSSAAIMVRLVFFPSAHVHAQGFSFQGLGHLHERIRESAAYGVSADGSVVVGYSTSGPGTPGPATFEGFRWTEAGGMVGLGHVSGGGTDSRAYGVSADGAVVVGSSNSAAFRWTEAGGMVHLGNNSRHAHGVSADGGVVVGERRSGADMEAFRWTAETGVVGVGYLEYFYWWEPISSAFGVSADCSVVVGGSISGTDAQQAFRWEGGTMPGLGDLPGGEVHSGARAILVDGSVIVGFGRSASGSEAFCWTEAGGMLGLGDLPGGIFSSAAVAVSADGMVIVGNSQTDTGSEAFIWAPEHGMRNLKSVLTAGGLNLAGWTLSNARGISADGFTIVGVGINPEGQTEAWRASLAQLQTSVTSNSEMLPLGFYLHPNYPNPFWSGATSRSVADAAPRGAGNPNTVISFQLSVNSHVRLRVFDVTGREVATLVDGNLAAGNHAVTFAPRNLAGGIYFYQLTAGKFSQTRKAVLVR